MGWIPTRTLNCKLMKTIYLAGPDVFLRTNASQVLHLKRLMLEEIGYRVVTPFDLELDNALAIYQHNIDLIRTCDIIVANVEPFRGTEPDSGTVFEIGYAIALGKLAYTYNNSPKSYLERLENHDRISGHSEFTPEPFGHKQNLMISCPVCGEFETFLELVSHLRAIDWSAV